MCFVGVHEDLQGKSNVPEAASQLKWLIPFSAAGEVEVVSKVEELWLAPLRTRLGSFPAHCGDHWPSLGGSRRMVSGRCPPSHASRPDDGIRVQS